MARAPLPLAHTNPAAAAAAVRSAASAHATAVAAAVLAGSLVPSAPAPAPLAVTERVVVVQSAHFLVLPGTKGRVVEPACSQVLRVG